MKIGILTQPLANNYGGLLQNYALQQVLIRMGHEPVTIDWTDVYTIKERLWRIRKKLLFIMGAKGADRPRYVASKKEEEALSQNTNYFIHSYIRHTTPPILSKNGFRKESLNHKYDAFIVGSDQVWRPGFNGFLKAMFLDFTEGMDVKRIAYAASFGTSDWEYKEGQEAECARLAKKFDLITVRESSGVKLCKEFFNVDAIHVLDPTMLLKKDDYEGIVIKENEQAKDGSLYYYILDPSEEKKKLIEKAASVKGLRPFTVMPKCQAENRTKYDVKHRIEDCVFPSLTSWIRGFMDAEMVIVDSFHGAVFSIIFNKPFWVISNSKRGNARFESLLATFHLEDRLITSDIIENEDWNRGIDWEPVNRIMEKEQNRCFNLLKEVLIK